MSEAAASRLFVYGTLMAAAEASSLGRSERSRLHARCRHLGPATIPGSLSDMGDYPALVETADVTQCVHGEILEIADPTSVFDWLDAYEGIDQKNPEKSEYNRVLRNARLPDGSQVSTWVYIYRSPPQGAPVISGGRWLPK